MAIERNGEPADDSRDSERVPTQDDLDDDLLDLLRDLLEDALECDDESPRRRRRGRSVRR